jgi:hypothetical protein
MCCPTVYQQAHETKMLSVGVLTLNSVNTNCWNSALRRVPSGLPSIFLALGKKALCREKKTFGKKTLGKKLCRVFFF